MKKENVIRLFAHIVPFILLTSCVSDILGVTGKGEIVTEERTVTAFDGIELLGKADVEITKGETFKVEVSDYENLTDFLVVEVSNKLLTIKRMPQHQVIYNSKAKVFITLPDPLYTITLGGTGNINVNSGFDALQAVKILGSGEIQLNENAEYKDIKITLIGVGNIKAKGVTDKLTANITGKGNLYLASLNTNNAECYISGSGNIYVDVNNQLKATISGTGIVEYTGNPGVNASITGSGSVIQK